MKKITLLVCLLVHCMTTYAQTGNLSSGNSVTPASNATYNGTYDGTTTLNASGSSLSTGDYNTLIGAGAASSLSSGSQNVFIGTAAGTLHTTQADNIFIGAFAADQATTGTDNVVIGTRAARTLNGTDNVVIGTEAGMVMELGASDNVIIGEEAGQALTTGDDNVFIGEDAGFNTTTASDNTFIGSVAGRTNTTGFRNTFIGNDAGYDNTTGSRNTAVGDSAGTDIGTGRGNTMIGQGAGAATEHANYNTFVGTRAGWDNNRNNNTSNANRNTYVGVLAGFSNRAGEDNVAMGAFADFGNSGENVGDWTDGIGNSTNRSRATFIGSHADAGNNDVTMLGYSTRVDGQYGIAIGNEADLANATGGIGIGYQAVLPANGDYSVGIGYQINVAEDDAVGIGRSVDIDNMQSVAVGANSVVQNDGAIVIGYGANSMDLAGQDEWGYDNPKASNTIAIGRNSAASGTNSVAIGGNANAAEDNIMLLGGATNPLSVGIGTNSPHAYASLEMADTNKGLLVNRLTTAQKTSLQGNLTATDYGMVVYDTDLNGLYVWDGAQWLGAMSDNLGSHLATTTLDMGTNAIDNTTYLDIKNTEGYGVRFWNGSNNYKMSMGNSSEYQYGVVTDFSIKNSMNSTAGRGWTWGVAGQTPIAAIDNTGKMQIANTMTIGAYTLPSTDGAATQVLSTDGAGVVTWVDATVNTDAQDLDLSGNTLSLTNDVTTVDLSGYLDNTDAQDLTLSGTTLSLTNDATSVDLSVLQDGTGTDNQELSLTTNTLSISGGTDTVDLSSYLDNTDAQNLTAATLTGSVLEIEIENGSSVSVDIAPLIADLENRVTVLEACECNTLPVEEYEGGRMGPVLHQNIPNPFDGTSAIKYYIPYNMSSTAHIVFSNGLGQIINTVELTQKGENEIYISSSDYSAGMYYYTLYIGGRKIDTKKMIVE